MNNEYIELKLKEINENRGDDEVAHAREDTLYHEFIKHISTLEIEGISDLAKLVLTTEDIDFARWCA